MRTMAGVWFSVIVLISIHNVFGNVCQKNDNEFTCDECVRCGGQWCKERRSTHCSFFTEDDWCPNDKEYLLDVDEAPSKIGTNFHPVYAERTLYIGKPDKIDIHYSAQGKKEPELMIVQSTQTFNIQIRQSDLSCVDSKCVITIQATPSTDFCNGTGGVTESVEVKINAGFKEEARIKYYVACACNCSKKVNVSSPLCNKNGNFSCGACSCDPGWKGDFCEKPICDDKRGDIVQCSLNPRNDADCYNNGYCGACETCICYTDREGSQYFDQENNCAGLCSVAAECEDCLVNNTLGQCSKCNLMTMQRYNESLTVEKDAKNRKIWVKCNETIDGCGRLDFYAKKNKKGEIIVMMVNHCNDINAAAYVADTKVPIILGILGILAAVAAVGGVMLWKHMNTVPPVPLNDPQYQNIGAEDCTGENPLYKPPTSSFKNPTYGKW